MTLLRSKHERHSWQARPSISLLLVHDAQFRRWPNLVPETARRLPSLAIRSARYHPFPQLDRARSLANADHLPFSSLPPALIARGGGFWWLLRLWRDTVTQQLHLSPKAAKIGPAFLRKETYL